MSTQKISKEFEKIYNETYTNTLKYIICKCKNINNVNDIIQETYLEIYKVLKKGKKILDYKSYAIAIAKNKIAQFFNSDTKFKTVSIFQEHNENEYVMELDSGIDIEAEFITKDNINEILKYINSLNAETAKIFYLYFILNMSFREISEELKINESTIKSSLYRMLRNIKNSYLGGVKNG